MRIQNAIAIAASALLFAGAVSAQPAAPPQATAPGPASAAETGPTPGAAATAAPAPTPSAPTKGGATVSGVTVTPTQPKPCGSRDKDCIAMIVAELKQRYPEELKRFCFGREMRTVRTEMVNQQLLDSLGGNDPPIPTTFGVNSALKLACASDKK